MALNYISRYKNGYILTLHSILGEIIRKVSHQDTYGDIKLKTVAKYGQMVLT